MSLNDFGNEKTEIEYKIENLFEEVKDLKSKNEEFGNVLNEFLMSNKNIMSQLDSIGKRIQEIEDKNTSNIYQKNDIIKLENIKVFLILLLLFNIL